MRKSLAAVVAFVAVAAMAEDYIAPRFICRLPLFPMCADDAPTSKWDPVSCADQHFDAALIESAANADRSAIALLERRYAEASTYAERIRIGSALLGRVADDGAIWKELAADAEHAVAFHADPDKAAEKLAAYCAKHDCEPDDYDRVAWQAFEEIAGDRRARPLLLRALASNDTDVLNRAILGLSEQHDETSFAAIAKALERFPEHASMLALSLIDFDTEAADCLAMKYLKGEDRELYEQERAESRSQR